jgi:hypothetical protein
MNMTKERKNSSEGYCKKLRGVATTVTFIRRDIGESMFMILLGFS